MVNVGKNIRKQRERIGLTQEELAERLDVSRGLIARIERSDKMPSLGLLFEIAKQLGCEPAKLVENTDPGEQGNLMPAT